MLTCSKTVAGLSTFFLAISLHPEVGVQCLRRLSALCLLTSDLGATESSR